MKKSIEQPDSLIENNTTTKSIIIHYGLIGGSLSIIIFLLNILLELPKSVNFGLGLIVLLVISYLTIKNYQRIQENISFKSLFWVGFKSLLIGLLMITFFKYLYTLFFDMESVEFTVKQSIKNLRNEGVSNEIIAKVKEESKSNMTAFGLAKTSLIVFVIQFFFSAFIAAIMSLILRRD